MFLYRELRIGWNLPSNTEFWGRNNPGAILLVYLILRPLLKGDVEATAYTLLSWSLAVPGLSTAE